MNDIDVNNPKKQYKGVWLPKEILDSPDLLPTEKILLAIIESLDDDNLGGCYASNQYLADKMQSTPKSISNVISDIKAKGYLEQVKFDGRTRFIRVVKPDKKTKKCPIQNGCSINPQVDPHPPTGGCSNREENRGGIIKNIENEKLLTPQVEATSDVDPLDGERMRPDVLYQRIKSFWKGPNEQRKQRIESVAKLQEGLSDSTILEGFRLLALNPSFKMKDGSTFTYTLTWLLVKGDLEKTANTLVEIVEKHQSKGIVEAEYKMINGLKCKKTVYKDASGNEHEGWVQVSTSGMCY